MNKNLWRFYAVVTVVIFLSIGTAQAQTSKTMNSVVTYNTVKIDGVNIFYREAGDKSHQECRGISQNCKEF